MKNNKTIYAHVNCQKSDGAFYTPSELSDFLSSKMVNRIDSYKKELKIMDPAIGNGELIISLLNKIDDSINVSVFGFDINEVSIKLCKERISKLFPNVKVMIVHGDFLEYCVKSDNLDKFDVIIANPPYIRTQILGSKQSKFLSEEFGLKGRVDIYQAFVVAFSKVLSKTGIVGVILSNKFLTTKGCGEFRNIIFNTYKIYDIWDFGDTKLFDAAVLPSISIFSLRNNASNHKVNFTSIYEINTDIETNNISNTPIDSINYDGIVKCLNQKSYLVKKGMLEFDGNPKNVWRNNDIESEKWLNHVKMFTWATFGDIGKIRVGVKTTADNVFIRDNWDDITNIEEELIKPLITHHVAGQFVSSSNKTKTILYTHKMINGKKVAIDINDYPVAKSYLENHKLQLESRNYIKKAKRNWYEIWVPQNPALWKQEKIVFRDICEKPTFWLDQSGCVVNGDCYWLVNDYHNECQDILWLILAVANSSFIEKFYDYRFNNKLYSNKRRFISQYVEHFPIPDPNKESSKEMIKLAKEIYALYKIDDIKAKEKLNKLVWKSFNLSEQ